jgi:hypothetical protein
MYGFQGAIISWLYTIIVFLLARKIEHYVSPITLSWSEFLKRGRKELGLQFIASHQSSSKFVQVLQVPVANVVYRIHSIVSLLSVNVVVYSTFPNKYAQTKYSRESTDVGLDAIPWRAIVMESFPFYKTPTVFILEQKGTNKYLEKRKSFLTFINKQYTKNLR